MTKSDCIRELLAEYQARRAQNELELEARIEDANRELRELEASIR